MFLLSFDSRLVTHERQDSFYKVLSPEQSKQAFNNEYDFDSPDAIDFDCLVEQIRNLKEGYTSLYSSCSSVG